LSSSKNLKRAVIWQNLFSSRNGQFSVPNLAAVVTAADPGEQLRPRLRVRANRGQTVSFAPTRQTPVFKSRQPVVFRSTARLRARFDDDFTLFPASPSLVVKLVSTPSLKCL